MVAEPPKHSGQRKSAADRYQGLIKIPGLNLTQHRRDIEA
jgi:hypothetical protein